MSSKVLACGESSANVQPMLWRRSGNQAPSSSQTGSFHPGVSLDHETATLRNRLLELEQSSRQAIDSTRRQAYAEGEAAGHARASAVCDPLLARLAAAVDELAQLRPKLRDEAESDVVKLSLAIAKRILHRELSVDPTAIQALVQAALDRLSRQEIYRVRVHPAQAAGIRSALAAGTREIDVEEDGRLEPGSLIFETNRGRMDASVSAQFDEIERGLTDRVQQR